MRDKLEALSQGILDHIRRYRIGLARFCYRALRMAHEDVTQGEIKHTLRYLREEQGYLGSAPLFGSQRYDDLSPRYLQQDDIEDDGLGYPLREDEKLAAYAMLRVCFDGDGAQRCKLTAGDFREHFPDLAESLDVAADPRRAARFYLAEDRLGLLRVDRGGHGRWDRIVSYCDRDLTRLAASPAFGELFAQGSFELTVVTATQQKAVRLRHALEDRPPHEGVHVRVVVLSELLHILAPPPQRRARSIPR